MKKLSLMLDELDVESFEAGATEAVRGTVHGAACTDGNTCRCATSLYACGTIRATYSCPVTNICL